ncbi:maleate cis-trans isomerase family protein [Pseudonocardia sp. CA-107938]|uniref:maleate cis-trans isomerase family protein n=1 Tax=Pseudonocardia sp. CA-107938 TaxID=3240021 RepID=UPI003D8D5301
MSSPHRVGLIVPSSNTTMETELPALLGRHASAAFTFHSSRAVLHTVDPGSLRQMVDQVDRCSAEVADAAVDVIAYACLIAIAAQGPKAHQEAEERIAAGARRAGCPAPVTSSAGALVRGIEALGLSRVAMVTPYVKPLTSCLVDYVTDYGVTVTDALSLEVADNLEVGRLDPARLPDHVERLDLSGAEAIVLSACVQMPSLAAIEAVEERFGLPVLTAATATAREVLCALGVDPVVPGGGALLRPLRAAS